MEFILSNNLTDEQWHKYFELNYNIRQKYYNDKHDPDSSIEKFKRSVQARYVTDPTHREYCLFDSGNAIGWLDHSTWGGNEFYCGLDAFFDEIPVNVLRVFLTKIQELMKTEGFNESIYQTFREGNINTFKSIDTPVYEELLISRLERENMDVSFYKSIAENSKLNSWKLKYYNEIPDSIIDSFIEAANKCFRDLVALNPYHVNDFSFTVNEWKETIEAMKKNGTTYGFNILFDKNDKIAGMCWILFDDSLTSRLRHIGGFTAVVPGYRGMGIGRYLKATLYLRLLEENKVFKEIITDTMPWNTYMCKINEELGFKPLRKGCRFKFTNDFLSNYLTK